MSAPPCVLSVDAFATEVGVVVDTIDLLRKLKVLRPACLSEKRPLFHVEQLTEVRALVARCREAVAPPPQVLTLREVSLHSGVSISKLSRAIIAGRIAPDFAGPGKRPAYFFRLDRVEEIRSGMGHRLRRLKPADPVLQQSGLFPAEAP